jgi:hypothetical protein
MTSKRTITATAPDGTTVSANVGPTRVVGAIRITCGDKIDGGSWGDGSRWLVTVHKTLANAITGPNQTPMWNHCQRWAIAINDNDQATGEWMGASK